jgi:hypothetical protein
MRNVYTDFLEKTEELRTGIVHFTLHKKILISSRVVCWYRSWVILKAFDAKEFIRRIMMGCFIVAGCMTILTLLIIG